MAPMHWLNSQVGWEKVCAVRAKNDGEVSVWVRGDHEMIVTTWINRLWTVLYTNGEDGVSIGAHDPTRGNALAGVREERPGVALPIRPPRPHIRSKAA